MNQASALHLLRCAQIGVSLVLGSVVLPGCASSSSTQPMQPTAALTAKTEAISADDGVRFALANRAIGNIDAAIQNLDQAIAQEPDSPSLLSFRASLHVDQRNYERALRDLDRSIALAPSAQAFYERARAHLFKINPPRGDVVAAIRDFDAALALQPDYPEALFDRAFAYHQRHDFQVAIAEFTNVIRLGTYRLAAAYDYRGQARQRNGEPLAALADFTRAAELDPAEHRHFVHRSGVFGDLKKYPEAMRDIELAIMMHRDIQALVARSTLLYALQRYDEAIADMSEVITQEVIAQAPAAGSYSDRALYHMAKGNFPAAFADIDEALKLDAKHVATLRLRYVAKNHQRDPAGALESLDAYLNVDPDSVEALLLRGLYRYNAEQLAGAASDFDRAIKLGPGNSEAHWGRGIVWLRVGQPEKSLPFFEKACALNPKLAKAYNSRAEAYLALGSFDAALTVAKEGLTIAPENSQLSYSLASAHYMLKDYARVVEACDDALRLDSTWQPAHDLRERAIKNLREAVKFSP